MAMLFCYILKLYQKLNLSPQFITSRISFTQIKFWGQRQSREPSHLLVIVPILC